MKNEEALNQRKEFYGIIRECEDLLPYLFRAYIQANSAKGGLFIEIRSCVNAMGEAERAFFNNNVNEGTIRMIKLCFQSLTNYKIKEEANYENRIIERTFESSGKNC